MGEVEKNGEEGRNQPEAFRCPVRGLYRPCYSFDLHATCSLALHEDAATTPRDVDTTGCSFSFSRRGACAGKEGGLLLVEIGQG